MAAAADESGREDTLVAEDDGDAIEAAIQIQTKFRATVPLESKRCTRTLPPFPRLHVRVPAEPPV